MGCRKSAENLDSRDAVAGTSAATIATEQLQDTGGGFQGEQIAIIDGRLSAPLSLAPKRPCGSVYAALGCLQTIDRQQAHLNRSHRPAPCGRPECLPMFGRAEPLGRAAGRPPPKGSSTPEAEGLLGRLCGRIPSECGMLIEDNPIEGLGGCRSCRV
jgi:hypothetical protein